MNRVLLIGDLHFDDDLIRRCERPQYSTVADMNVALTEAWNEEITDNDVVIVVGDFAKQGSSFERVSELLRSLNGRKRLVVGNHDNLNPADYLKAGFELVYDVPILYDGFWLISHEPLYVTENMPYANIFAHVHTNPNYKDVSVRGFCVSAERLGLVPIDFKLVKAAVYRENV